MNKKIFTLFALLILVTSISAVSAFDLGDIFGMGRDETLTIKDISFNIPAGYKEDSTNPFNIINEFKDKGYDFDGKVYVKDNTKVGVFVYKSNSSDAGKAILKDFNNATIINDIGGHIGFEDNEYVFVYTKNNSTVMIASNDRNAIDDFIILS